VAERNPVETFKEFTKRTGKAELKKMLEDLTRPPAADRSFFSDWNDPREYTLGDMGEGECAGEVVSAVEFGLAAAERELFEAQVALENGNAEQAGRSAYRSMLNAAKALVKSRTLISVTIPIRSCPNLGSGISILSCFSIPLPAASSPTTYSTHTVNHANPTPRNPAAT